MKQVNIESVSKMVNTIIDNDQKVSFGTLSDELSISQVVKFFEKQGRSFTKTMIQNYIRVGVLPPPVNKRYYTTNHLILLALIDNLKSIYSLEEIRDVLAPIRNNPEIFDDDIIKTTDIYNNYIELRKQALKRWSESLPEALGSIDKMLDADGVPEAEKSSTESFMLVLNIMAQTLAMKDLVEGILYDRQDSGQK